MAKILVIDSEQQTTIPFLRGILTRSLQDSGVPFDEAYRLASEVRDELGDERGDETTITTRKLRATVIRHLRRSGNRSVAERYQTPRQSLTPVLVEYEDGRRLPFSRTRHQRALECSGLPSTDAGEVTQALYAHLIDRQRFVIQSHHLDGLTYECLKHEMAPEAAHRYLVWTEFAHSGRPLILLIGGTAGCGKSTTATAVANRLDIVRTQSTDMLREVMRMMIPERLLPVLHQSSFEAWRALPGASDSEDHLADGYYAQAELLAVACEAVLNRALRERVSLILEGVHIQASLVDTVPEGTDAVVVPVMLAVLNPEQLRSQIRGRGSEVPHRRAKRYLKNFEHLWQLQTILLSDADRAHIPIIENQSKEKVYLDIMRVINDTLAEKISATPRQVFGRNRRRRPRRTTHVDQS